MNKPPVVAARTLAPLALAVAGALFLGGCASTGAKGGSARSPAGAPATSGVGGAASRPYYADWYDSTAIVLPPPPQAER